MAERRMLLIKKTSNIPPDNEIWYTSIDGNIIDVDTQYIPNNLLSNTYEDKGVLVFENDVNDIDNLFSDKTQLTEVWLPNYNIITSVSAFNRCTNLIQVNNSKQLENIMENTFDNCINLQQIKINSVLILDMAFYNCTSLNYVKISKKIEQISQLTFENCTNLESIDYEGTIEEWNNIDIRNYWHINSAIKTIHCSDGDIQL